MREALHAPQALVVHCHVLTSPPHRGTGLADSLSAPKGAITNRQHPHVTYVAHLTSLEGSSAYSAFLWRVQRSLSVRWLPPQIAAFYSQQSNSIVAPPSLPISTEDDQHD